MSPIETSKITYADTAPTAATASGEVIPANGDRKYLLVINDSDAVVYIKVGAAAVLSQGIRLNANGGNFEMSMGADNIDTRVINSIHGGAGTKQLLVIEGT